MRYTLPGRTPAQARDPCLLLIVRSPAWDSWDPFHTVSSSVCHSVPPRLGHKIHHSISLNKIYLIIRCISPSSTNTRTRTPTHTHREIRVPELWDALEMSMSLIHYCKRQEEYRRIYKREPCNQTIFGGCWDLGTESVRMCANDA